MSLFAVLFSTVNSMAASPISALSQWGTFDNPLKYDPTYEVNWSKLPLNGKLSNEQLPWSDTYWPNTRGGISNRWQAPPHAPFSYELYSLEKLKTFKPAQMNTLSPAEKWDLFQRRYDYPTVLSERRRNSAKDQTWTGLCHGWSPASLNHAEPKPITVTNADGLVIPFTSSDLKALITYQYGVAQTVETQFLGLTCRVDPKNDRNFSCRDDINAGAFHLVLTNEIGIRKRGFVSDLDAYVQVWNYPIFSYTSSYVKDYPPSEQSAPGTVRRVLVSTRIEYATERAPSPIPVLGTSLQSNGRRDYLYTLDLDSNNRILGGDWMKNSSHPDFIWTVKPLKMPSDLMQLL